MALVEPEDLLEDSGEPMASPEARVATEEAGALGLTVQREAADVLGRQPAQPKPL